MMKVCNQCFEEKPFEEFGWANNRSRSGEVLSQRPRPKCKSCQSKNHRLKKYGITHEQYLSMVQAQGGLCLICHEPEPRKGGLVIDHDHETGKVRGLLCHTCNQRLGIWEYNFDRFSAYLEASNAHVHGLDCGSTGNMQSTSGGLDNCPGRPDHLVGV